MAVRRILEILEDRAGNLPMTARQIADIQGRSMSGTCTELRRMLRYRLVGWPYPSRY